MLGLQRNASVISEARPGGDAGLMPAGRWGVYRPTSDNLIEMAMERNPAQWAAYQIAAKGSGCKTVGEAMDMIEAIVNEAIRMAQSKGSRNE
jgi:hypothetical protein